MIRPRGAFSGGHKASPQTLCQKCLKRDDYECKATTQERPYASRPSRTQQLANPKLVPKLTSDVPNDLLRKKGIADEQLAKREEERGRKRALDENHPAHSSTKRSRSSYSSTSVSTISTNYSHSISSRHPKSRQSDTYHLSQSRSGQPFRQQGTHKRRRSSSSTSTYSSSSSVERRKPSRRKEESDRNTRRRRSSISPDTRGRDRDYNGRRSSRRSRSQSKSIDRSRVARNRNSMTPGMRSNHDRDGGRNTVTWGNGRRYSTNDDDRYGGSYRDEGRGARDGVKAQKPPPPLRAKKERSLSPFSKRLALTQAMNSGRG